jgi:hypothetical protein
MRVEPWLPLDGGLPVACRYIHLIGERPQGHEWCADDPRWREFPHLGDDTLFAVSSPKTLLVCLTAGWPHWRLAYPSYALPMLRTTCANLAGDIGTPRRVCTSTCGSRPWCPHVKACPRSANRPLNRTAHRPLDGCVPSCYVCEPARCHDGTDDPSNLSFLWWNVPRGKGTNGRDVRRSGALRAHIAAWLRTIGRMPPTSCSQ